MTQKLSPKLKNLGPSRPSSWVSWAPVKSPSGTVISITSRVMAMAKTASLKKATRSTPSGSLDGPRAPSVMAS
jgi:hypothetical protein